MHTSAIREYITAQPFRPFSIHMADGRRIPVFARDFILISPAGRYVDMYQPDETHDILDALFVTGVGYYPSEQPAAPSGQTPPTGS